VKIIFYYLLILLLISCGAHLPVDVGPNYASKGYHSVEFDISNTDGIITKELGIANIYLKKSSDYSKVEIQIYGIYKGNLILKSNACGIDINTSFSGITKFKLSELISEPIKCSINVIATTDAIDGKEHNIIESGIIKINVLDDNSIPLDFSYFKTLNTSREYYFIGQGSLQRPSGSLTSSEKINFFPKDSEGGLFRIVGCGFEHTGKFEDNFFEVSLKNIYKKDILDINDSCDFEILVISNAQEFSHKARLSINIYESNLLKLEKPNWAIRRNSLGRKDLVVESKPYVAICSINYYYAVKKSESKLLVCKNRYFKDTVYWIRTITSNGRKNVFGIKNGDIIWQE
jgi:hypothetical protein